ncbi:rod shape-determining protein RodA [Wenyingzhuangia aestuarii]|uniref:rod shape-determining protein RodA n=1 Tax=Wenyingzhuangia aestuarii TaxID=1647582 RepID=UPI00143B4534|nr:rod shape-determining protein RodA [Wenyingzhuangia aestuarii]NJB82968.1 rod shape determining protein RodA [Wenyingzhuangia aestuarii]
MRSQRNNIKLEIDWILIFLYLALVGFGWMNIYSASSSADHNEIFDFAARYGKQIIWIGLGILISVFLLFIESSFYEKFAAYIYLATMFLLAGLFIFGKNINGATSWYSIGSFSLQPTEFAKTGTVLALARLLNDRQFSFKPLKNKIKTFIIITIPAILITLQPDPGSALVYLSFILLFYREGLSPNILIVGITAVALFLATLVFGYIYVIGGVLVVTTFILWYIAKGRKKSLRFEWPKILSIVSIILGYVYSVYYLFNYVFKQRHRDRFNILLGLSDDTSDIGYNTYQSIKTISSGGFWGKGYLQGDRTQGKFVPEQDTDYIFSTIGEEWGFWGSMLVVVFFITFILRIVVLAEKQKSTFSRVYGYGVACIFFFHVLINIAMVIGLFPTIGIPLPFFSYGGSSLWGFTMLLFIFIKLDASKNYEL